MLLRTLTLTTALALVGAPALARENFALLVAVDTYENLHERYWLKGPSNDAELVRTYLTTQAPVPFDADNVTLLADGVEGAQIATLAAIRAAVADITARAEAGDFVYMHFSGHGTQAPERVAGSELDGLDELFLPADIGPWSNTVGSVENALVDDEIGTMIDGLRAKGAHVFAVFDSCHSGTVTRAAPSGDEEVRTRQLPPEALGIDPALMDEVATRALPTADPRAQPEAALDGLAEAAGSFVGFYAAQTNEVTPEQNMPRGKPGRKPHGVFTYALMETLAEYPAATYAQIGQEVLRKYSVKNLARSTPMFEGDLDRTVFGGEPGARVAQWPATPTDAGLTIAAGTLHGLSEGGLLAVLASAADDTSAALGYVQVATLDTFSATAIPVVHAGKTLPPDLPRGLTLRKLDAALDFSLTVALPEPGSAPADALLAALATITEDAGPRLHFVAAGADADLRLAVIPASPRPDALWVLPSTGLVEEVALADAVGLSEAEAETRRLALALSNTPSVGTVGKDSTTLAFDLSDTLVTMSKAINVMRLGAELGAGSLDVDVEVLTRSPENRTLRALSRTEVPRLIPDDEVHVLAQNNMKVPVDVNVLYVGSDYAVTHWFSGRLQPGDTLQQGLFKISDSSLGSERMVVVMTPVSGQTAIEDLSFLAQDPVTLTRSIAAMTREIETQTKAPPSMLTATLMEAGFGTTTRGVLALSDDTGGGPMPGILQVELRTVAAPD